MGEMEYKRLRDLAREEKASPSLVALPSDFYESVQSFLSSKHSEMETSRSVLQMREFENAMATVKELSLIRQQKILFNAIRSAGVHGKTDEMTREEHALYDRFCDILDEERARMDSMLLNLKAKPSTPEPEKGNAAQAVSGQEEAPEQGERGDRLKKVRFTKDVPAYRGAGSQTFGPFKSGQEEKLPPQEADWLLKGKLAQVVE